MQTVAWIPWLSAAALLAGGGALRAQCPDGTPPPCGRSPVAAAPRRTTQPLDGKAWIVLPFDNTTKAADVEWLRDTSVELLYLDLSRWNDIRVVDAKQVADFMREVPSAAGAANLAMGDVLKLAAIRSLQSANMARARCLPNWFKDQLSPAPACPD